MSRTLKVMFIASLLLNLLVVGVIAGHFAKRALSPPGGPMVAFIEQSSLPMQQKQALVKSFRASVPFSKRNRAQMREEHRKVIAILEAETFDAQAFQTQLATVRALRQRSMNGLEESLVGLAENISHEERKALAHMLKRMHRKMGRMKP